MTNFYVPIEIKNREFYSRLLLSLEACKKYGWNIFFGFRGHVNYFAQNYTPGFYLGLGSINVFDNLFLSIKKNGTKILLSDEEGLVVYKEEYYKKFKVSKKIIKIVDLIFTWGNKNTNILKKNFNIKNKIITSGNPRMDLLTKPFCKIYNKEVKIIKKKYKNFYLICTNFSYNNYFDKKYKYSQILKKRNFFKSSSDFKKWRDYEKIKDKIFFELICFLKETKKVKGNVSFVIRCHPSENHEIYQKIQKEYPNIYFDNSYSVHPWILACKGIINHYCTTTFEGLMCGKTSYTLKPKYYSPLEDSDYFKNTINAKDHKELIKLINQKREKKINNIAKHYSENLNFKNKKYAFKQILKSIKLIDWEKSQKNSEFFIFKYKIKNYLNILKNIILFRTNHYINHKIQNISNHEINHFVNLFPEYKNQISIRKLSKNFFILTRCKK